MNKLFYIFITFFLGITTVFAWVAPVSEFSTPPPLTNTSVQSQVPAYTSTVELTYDPNNHGVPQGPDTFTETNCLGSACTTRSGYYNVLEYANYGATCDTAAARAGLTADTYTCSVNSEYFAWTCAATYGISDPCFAGYGDTIGGGGYYLGNSFKERYVTEVYAGTKSGGNSCKPFPAEWNTQAPYYPGFTYLPRPPEDVVRATSCSTKVHTGTIQVPVATLAANPTSVTSGNSASLSYSCTNGATSATIDNGVGTLSNSDSGVVSVTPSTTTTYTLTCTNSAGSGTDQATVTVSALPDLRVQLAPTGNNSFAADTAPSFGGVVDNIGNAVATNYPNILQVLDTSETTSIARFVASPATVTTAASNSSAVSGTIPANTLTAGNYKVRFCANMNTSGTSVITEGAPGLYGNNCGPALAVSISPATVTTPAPTCTFTNPSGLTLTWSCTNATSCTGGGFSTGFGSPTSGSATAPSAGTYTLSCPGPGGTFTQALTIGGACSGTKTGTITATPARVKSGTPTVLTVSNVTKVQTSCIVSGPGVSQTIPANSCTVTGTTINTPAIVTQSTYLLTCDGTEVSRVIVNVLPRFVEF